MCLPVVGTAAGSTKAQVFWWMEKGVHAMEFSNRDDSPAVDYYAWPRPVNPRLLRIVKAVLGAAMVLVLLTQVVPANLLGGLSNHFFTILLLLSWAGPARRMMRRYTPGGRNSQTTDEP